MSNGANREMTQDDFDLERIIDCLDQAMMSEDPRIRECLRRLMVTVALIDPEGRRGDKRVGPLRQLVDDIGHLNRRLSKLEEELAHARRPSWQDYAKDFRQQPWIEPYYKTTITDEQWQSLYPNKIEKSSDDKS